MSISPPRPSDGHTPIIPTQAQAPAFQDGGRLQHHRSVSLPFNALLGKGRERYLDLIKASYITPSLSLNHAVVPPLPVRLQTSY